MKKKNVLLSLLLVLLITLMGCGAASSKAVNSVTADSAAGDSGGTYLSDDIYSSFTQESEYEDEAAAAEEAGGDTLQETVDTGRKLIKNVNLQVETEEFDALLAAVRQKTDALSGYIEESYTYNGSAYYGKGTRNANLTIRIPADKLDDFLSEIAEVSNVISRNESVTDVTLKYVDMESRKKALVTEQDRLLELLERAENIEDIISIESRLSEVRYQIESMESQLRTMDNLISYSTVYLSVEEVKQLTPVAEQSVGEKIVTGFKGSLVDVLSGLLNFGIGLIIYLPYILLWGAVIAAAVVIFRMVFKKRGSKKAEKGQRQAVKEQAKQEQMRQAQIKQEQTIKEQTEQEKPAQAEKDRN